MPTTIIVLAQNNRLVRSRRKMKKNNNQAASDEKQARKNAQNFGVVNFLYRRRYSRVTQTDFWNENTHSV